MNPRKTRKPIALFAVVKPCGKVVWSGNHRNGPVVEALLKQDPTWTETTIEV